MNYTQCIVSIQSHFSGRTHHVSNQPEAFCQDTNTLGGSPGLGTLLPPRYTFFDLKVKQERGRIQDHTEN